MSKTAFTDPPLEQVSFDPGGAREIRRRDLVVRFAFGAVTSALAAITSIAFGPRAGGIFLAFPAILGATITLIEDEDTTSAAREDARGAIAGSIALAAFAAVAAALFGQLPAAAVLTIATATWALVAFTIYFAAWRPRGRSRD